MCGKADGSSRRIAQFLLIPLVGALLASVPTGCRSPFDAYEESSGVRGLVDLAIERELAGLAPSAARETTQPPSTVEDTLGQRRDELERISPATEASATTFELGLDLAGGDQQTVAITLDQAIEGAIRHNLAVGSARLEPAIGRADLVAALAAFDFVLFGSANATKTDQPQAVPVLNGINLGTPFRANDQSRFETGVQQTNTYGGALTVSSDLIRDQNNAPGIGFSPDPAYTAAVRLGYVQPLLRNFGQDVNLANVRLAANAEQRATQDLARELLDVVELTEQTYWSLVLAWRDAETQQWLVDVGIEVRDVLDRRREFDTKLAQYSDAVARVEQRKADVIRARRRVRELSDSLKVLVNDPELTVGSLAVLRPSDTFRSDPLSYDLRDAIMTGIDFRPEVRSARLALDDASIGVAVADDARLPRLDLSAQAAWFGQEDDPGSAYSNASDLDFIDYVLGLNFEYPLGNRAAEAGYRRARLARAQATLAYRNAVQNVVFDVRAALRDVVTNYELIAATRSFRVAQAENLRALLVEEETLAGLTPEFLNLKFQRQETLATARRQELEALANFDQAIAALESAMGIALRSRKIAVEWDPWEDEGLLEAGLDDVIRR